jgi:polyketide cyclase/dehydrase/lipid transport protein
VFISGLTPIEIKLISWGIAGALGGVAYLVIGRARAKAGSSNTLEQLKRQGEVINGVVLVVFGLAILGFVVILILARVPLWIFAVGLPVAAWAAWWLPAGHRQYSSQASIVVQGLPARVSAFVADVPGQSRWAPNVLRDTPAPAGPRGPRFTEVDRMPDGKEIAATVELTRDEPGVAVAIQIVGAGTSGDYYTFVAQGGGTLVMKRCVSEVPYINALAGFMFSGAYDAAAAQQRRVDELQALKTAFESAIPS